jgi:glucose/arabinose dehydrogenase
MAQLPLTPVLNLGLVRDTVEVPQKFAGKFPQGQVLQIPAGYKARIFHAGIATNPRFLTWSPQGVLHLADMNPSAGGKVYAFPDADMDGVADTAIVVADGFNNCHDMKFYKGHLYVSEPTRVWDCADTNADGYYETKTPFITNLGGGSTLGHITRTLVFDSINSKLYVSVGSRLNVGRETDRAIIEQYNDDGTGRRVFATGARNAVGMTLQPVTNRLWANNNGSDRQGNEIPPEWIDIVRDGGFYGHPFAYADKQWFDFDAHPDYQALKPITAADSAEVDRMVMPAALIRAHQAPMGIKFLNQAFASLQNGFLMALRGSWNTTAPNAYRGYKLIYADLSSDQDTTVNYIADFCEGFLTDSINQVFFGRPVGLEVDNRGNIYLSSNEGNDFVMILQKVDHTGLRDQLPELQSSAVYPNPFHSGFTVSYTLAGAAQVSIELYDITGRLQKTFAAPGQAGEHNFFLDTSEMGNGMYFLRISTGDTSVVHKVSRVP